MLMRWEVIRLHHEEDMFYVHSLGGMWVSEHRAHQCLLFHLLSVLMANIAMVPNLEDVL